MAQVEPIPGRRAVHEALRTGRDATRLFVSATVKKDDTLHDILDLARRLGIEVQVVNPGRLSQLAKTARHQGVVLMAKPRGPLTVNDLIDDAKAAGKEPFLVCIDGIEDPQNVGAIARTALLAGAHGLVLPERGAAKLGPGAMRASAGALASLPVAQVSSMPSALGVLKRSELYVIGADANGGKPIWTTRLTGPLALVMGSENSGLSHATQKLCDELTHIPQPGGDLSLNVSAAAAIILYERVRQSKLV